MNILKKYIALLVIVLTVIILVIIRLLGAGGFRPDAKKWYEPSVTGTNIISEKQAHALNEKKLIINLNDAGSANDFKYPEAVNIPAGSILENENLKTIRQHNGPVIIYSSEISVSARIWMILSQMGYKNIYILTTDTGNEVLKYKFRIDSTASPEL
jgi:rhodanese-related sulfurtransferase